MECCQGNKYNVNEKVYLIKVTSGKEFVYPKNQMSAERVLIFIRNGISPIKIDLEFGVRPF